MSIYPSHALRPYLFGEKYIGIVNAIWKSVTVGKFFCVCER